MTLIDLNSAWKHLCEGDLPSLAEELGAIEKEKPNGSKETKGLCETGGGLRDDEPISSDTYCEESGTSKEDE